jgi:hypothetical protein
MPAMLRHSLAQRRQAIAQSLQCSCWCCSHSLAQASQISAHASHRVEASLLPRCIRPTHTRHTWAQSISVAMQWVMLATSASCRQLAAQWSQAAAQSLQASIQVWYCC